MGYLLSKQTHLLLLSILLWSKAHSIAAQPAIWQEMKQQYPDESAIFLNRDKVITLTAEGDSVRAVAELDERILFLKDRMSNATDMRIYGSQFHEIVSIQAATDVWEKSKYKSIPLTGLTRQQEDDGSIFYDDSYFYHMSFPAAQAGNQAHWQYKEKYRDARYMSAFYFQDYLPQRKGSLTIRAPKNIELSWSIMNDPQKAIQFKQFEKGGLVHYEWSVENLPQYKWEDDSPKLSYYAPLVVFRVTQLKTKEGNVTMLADVNSLHKWYYETIRPADETPSIDFTSFAKSIVSPQDNEHEKVRKVFYWVQDNIRYIAFEDGMRGFVPHKPSYVLEKRYGDCKDMASLIVGLLRANDITSYYTWIGTRDIPFRYAEVPSPVVDNHMIATYIDKNNQYYFLDGTSNHTPIPFPSAMIQGKEALISRGPTAFEVKEVPVIPAIKNNKVDTLKLQIDNNTLTGKGRAYLTGYQKVEASYDFNKTVEQRKKENFTRWVQKGSNKFVLDQYNLSNLADKDTPLALDYAFHIKDYITVAGDEMFVNLNLEKIFYNLLIKMDRKTPVEREYAFSTSNHYQLEIPKGFEIGYQPPNASFSTEVLGFEIVYTKSDNTVAMDFTFTCNSLLLTKDQFETWNKAVRELSNAYKESIIFKRKL